MTYTITRQCIRCDRCSSVCPNQAIQSESSNYWIDPDRCNNCVGQYGVPQCWAVCPTNDGCVPYQTNFLAIPPSQSGVAADYWESWFVTYNQLVSRLKASKQNDYWHWWFETYANTLAKHLDRPIQPTVGVNS